MVNVDNMALMAYTIGKLGVTCGFTPDKEEIYT